MHRSQQPLSVLPRSPLVPPPETTAGMMRRLNYARVLRDHLVVKHRNLDPHRNQPVLERHNLRGQHVRHGLEFGQQCGITTRIG